MTPSPELVEVVAAALQEDLGPGDVTSEASVPEELTGRGVFLAKGPGVLSGLEVVREVFRQLDPALDFEAGRREGELFEPGEELAVVSGSVRALLAGERVALNFLQHLCGIATLTRLFVLETEDTGVRIVDTRKTTPGLRRLEKAAVRAGGGHNHRFGLFDGVLLKDNHLVAAGGVAAAIAAAKAHAHHLLKVEVEVTSHQQLEEALAAGADVILLDNMSPAEMAEAVRSVGGRVPLEASGNVTREKVGEIARTGVDFISVGRLTHSAPACDISLELSV
jgi:nicotinate-nucleotide pyrophosphorylase (carboxylating)